MIPVSIDGLFKNTIHKMYNLSFIYLFTILGQILDWKFYLSKIVETTDKILRSTQRQRG